MGRSKKTKKSQVLTKPLVPPKSPTTSGSSVEKKTSKKQKLKNKRTTLLEKLQEAKKASWSNPKTGLTLHELLASLPDVSNALEQQEDTTKTSLTIAERNQILHKGKTDFGLVLGHPQFQANPLGTIREHLTNVIAKSQSEKEIKKQMRDFEERHKPVKPKADTAASRGKGKVRGRGGKSGQSKRGGKR